jgi:hypothetical protein
MDFAGGSAAKTDYTTGNSLMSGVSAILSDSASLVM